jgi:hypothetical protein
MSETWSDEYLRQIDDCERRESRLTDWERTFLDSLRMQLENGRPISAKQIECLDKAWERATARG